MRPARTEADKAWRRLVMRYRYKRLTGLTRRSIGVPQMHAAGPRDWGAPGVHTLHDGYVAWVLAFGSKPRGQRKQ